MRTVTERSAGGVLYRRRRGTVTVVLISVGEPPRWQLPKGLIEPDEEPERAAEREVREETGLHGVVVAPLDDIRYWYQRSRAGGRVRVRKLVHFFLLRYRSGRVADHDHEVHEARWFPLPQAVETLAYGTERKVLESAARQLEHDAANG